MIRNYSIILVATVIGLAPSGATAETASDIIDKMVAAEKAKFDGVSSIFVRTETMGHVVPEYLEWDAANQYMRLVPIPELLDRQQGGMDATELRVAADVIRSQSGAAEAGFREEVAKVGFGGDLGFAVHMAQTPPKPWLTSSPGGMMNLYADFLEAGARAKVEMAAEKAAEPGEIEANRQRMQDLKDRTQVFGREQMDGREVIVIGVDDVNDVQDSGDGIFTTQSVRIRVDAQRYLPVQFKIDGILEENGEARAVSIEREDRDFRTHSSCGDYLRPQSSVMRMGGVLSDAEKAQIVEAQAQLADFEKQLESMPASQRKMMEGMIGPQLEMVRKLAAGGGIEVVSNVVEVRCGYTPTAEDLAYSLVR